MTKKIEDNTVRWNDENDNTVKTFNSALDAFETDISTYYKKTPISKGITGGTTKPVTTVFPEDTEKEGYVKIILKKGKYRIKTSINNTNSKYTGNRTDIDFTNEKLGIIQRLH